jgi:glycerophosphoryl diester phosphodiesterase
VVVHHDPTIDRLTGAEGVIAHLDLAALQAFDAGFMFTAPDGTHPHRGRGVCVPTLAALCEACPEAPLNIEIKQDDPPIETAVLEVLAAHGARSRTLLAAEHHHIMARIRAAAPDMPTSASAAEVADFVRRVQERDLAGYRPPFVALQVPPAYMTSGSRSTSGPSMNAPRWSDCSPWASTP